MKRLFLSIFFGNEGGISKEGKIRISINKTAPLLENGINFMENIKKLFEEFGVGTTKIIVKRCWKRKSGEETYSVQFGISERLSMALFYKEIGFACANAKQTLLKNVFENLVRDYLHKCNERILIYGQALELRKVGNSIAEISRKLGIADSTTQAWCRGAFKPDYVEKKEELFSVLNQER